MEALRDLADDFNARDPRKLYRLARQRDLDVTQAMAFEALKADVGRQVQAARPRALGKLAAVEPLQNKNAKTVGRATELCGHDRPGQRVRHAGQGAARSRAPHEAGPQRHCRDGPGHPDAEERPGHEGGARAGSGATTLRRRTARPRTWRSSRPQSSGSSKTTPTSSSTTRTSPTGGRLPSADERGEELQPSVRRRAAAGGRGLHDRPQHGGARDPAECRRRRAAATRRAG